MLISASTKPTSTNDGSGSGAVSGSYSSTLPLLSHGGDRSTFPAHRRQRSANTGPWSQMHKWCRRVLVPASNGSSVGRIPRRRGAGDWLPPSDGGRSAGSGRKPQAGIRAPARAFDVLPASCTRLRGLSLYDFRQIRNVQRCHIDAFLRDGGICRQHAPMRYVVALSAAPHPVFPP